MVKLTSSVGRPSSYAWTISQPQIFIFYYPAVCLLLVCGRQTAALPACRPVGHSAFYIKLICTKKYTNCIAPRVFPIKHSHQRPLLYLAFEKCLYTNSCYILYYIFICWQLIPCVSLSLSLSTAFSHSFLSDKQTFIFWVFGLY